MERPRLSQRAAAAACGVSLSTIRRRREAGEFPNAVKDPALGWLIPVPDLLAAGLRVNAPAPPDEQQPAPPLSEPSEPDSAAMVTVLRIQLAEERHRRELAEAEARHQAALVAARDEHLADVRRAMLALTAGSASEGEPGRVPAQSEGHERAPDGRSSTPVAERPTRRWLRRS